MLYEGVVDELWVRPRRYIVEADSEQAAALKMERGEVQEVLDHDRRDAELAERTPLISTIRTCPCSDQDSSSP